MEKQEQYLRELKQLFWENNLSLDLYQLERLAHYTELVAEKNKTINLISRKDIDNIVENHVFFSAIMSEYLPPKGNYFLDVGTGGGFPGIPLAIMKPMLQGVLVDSTTKKSDAVKGFVNSLKLGNVTVENCRVESDEFKEKYKNKFDLIISRATVPLIILFRYAIPLVKEKAYILASKGGDISKEFKLAEMKYKSYIKKSTIFEIAYKPNNIRNNKGKKIILLELHS